MLQPSQIYINKAKLEAIIEVINDEGFAALEPIPIKELDTEMVIVDGHTRALAYHIFDIQEVEVVFEDEELDWQMYRFCVYWAKENDIFAPQHLEERIISNEDYQVLWIDQCQKAKEYLKNLENAEIKDFDLDFIN